MRPPNQTPRHWLCVEFWDDNDQFTCNYACILLYAAVVARPRPARVVISYRPLEGTDTDWPGQHMTRVPLEMVINVEFNVNSGIVHVLTFLILWRGRKACMGASASAVRNETVTECAEWIQPRHQICIITAHRSVTFGDNWRLDSVYWCKLKVNTLKAWKIWVWADEIGLEIDSFQCKVFA